MDETTIFIGYILGIGLNLMIANAKKRSMGLVFLASLLLTPVISYLYLLAVPIKQNEDNTNNQEKTNVETTSDPLIQLTNLYNQRLLTRQEFEEKKRQLLRGESKWRKY